MRRSKSIRAARPEAANAPAFLVVGGGWLALEIACRLAAYRDVGTVTVAAPRVSSGSGEPLCSLSPLAAPLSAAGVHTPDPLESKGMVPKRPLIRLLPGPHVDLAATHWRQLTANASGALAAVDAGTLETLGIVAPDTGRPGAPAAMIDRVARITDPDVVTARLRRCLRRAGVRFIDAAPLALHTKGGRVTGLETAAETLIAERVILADPRYNRSLAESAGTELPVQEREVLVLETEPVRPVLETAILDTARGVWIGQGAGGAVTIAAGLDALEPPGAGGGPGREDGAEALARAAVALCPRLSRLRVRRYTRVPLEISADRLPLSGPLDVDGLFAAAGTGPAHLLVPTIAEIAAAAAADRETPAAAPAFRATRFAEIRPLSPPRPGGAIPGVAAG